jgi:hypothetical protein
MEIPMIDAKLLQSFMSDIEWLRTMSNSPASKSSAASQKANSAEFDPFEEILAKAIGILESSQSQGNAPLSEANSALQLVGADMFNTWLNPGSNGGGYVTTEDIDKLFPDLAALNSMLG